MIKKYFFKFLIFLFFFANAFSQAKPLPPSYLTVELLEHPERVFITDFTPEFGWVMTSDLQNNYQTAYQILVASSKDSLAKNVGAWWDTGKIKLNHSINIEYAGKQLMPNSNYYWQVRTWDRENNSSDYSQPQTFRTGEKHEKYATVRCRLEKHEIGPVKIVEKSKGHYFVDFGKAAFGTIKFEAESKESKPQVEIHLGETISAEIAWREIPKAPSGIV